jgi:hypothetical protein
MTTLPLGEVKTHLSELVGRVLAESDAELARGEEVWAEDLAETIRARRARE